MYEYILEKIRQVVWIFGNVTCAGYPLKDIDTISETGEINRNSVLNLVVYGVGHLPKSIYWVSLYNALTDLALKKIWIDVGCIFLLKCIVCKVFCQLTMHDLKLPIFKIKILQFQPKFL